MAVRPQERHRLEVARDWSGPSPREYDGWTPTYETTYEYETDAWGRPTRLVRSITRQVEGAWDDNSRNVAEGLARYHQELCPGCGLHPVILEDPEHNVFTFEDRLCKVCAGQTQYGRMLAKTDADWDEQHEKALPQEARPGDGRHTFMRPLSAEEIASRKRPRSRAEGPSTPPA